MPFCIAPIVEGHGEVLAVPNLIRRVIAELDLAVPIEIGRPIRQARGSLLKEGGIEAAVRLAALVSGTSGAILVLLDSEGDCPAELAPSLLARARNARSDKRISVVLAHHEFEAWFLASASSLKGCCGLSQDINDHPTPEQIQDCKRWLEEWMPRTTRYAETADQPALASLFDLALARRNASSFDKLYRELESICRDARSALDRT